MFGRATIRLGIGPHSSLLLITNKKSYMSFRLVPKSVTLNDLERRNRRYFALFHRIRVAFGAHCLKLVEDIHKLSTTEM